MITKEVALALRHGQTLYHKTLRNKDGSALTARVNGKVKTWKRRPDDFRIPMMRRLRECFYIDGGPNMSGTCNQPAGNWSLVDPLIKERLAKRYNLSPDCPWQMIYDSAADRDEQSCQREILRYAAEYEGAEVDPVALL